jgi:hypothetical protein
MMILSVWDCAACPMQERIVAPNPIVARDKALMHGWAIVSNKDGIAVCPGHNPARIEFGRMLFKGGPHHA